MTDEQLIIWAAGFFDGEGCINIAHQNSRRKLADGTPVTWVSHHLNVSICQKDPRPLQKFHEMFGGHFYPYQAKGKTYWRWHTWSAGALHVIETLMPFMILKPERAAVAIKFQQSLTAYNRDYGRKGYPDWVKAELASYFDQMKIFNKRDVDITAKTVGAKPGSPNYFPAKKQEKGDISTVQ